MITITRLLVLTLLVAGTLFRAVADEAPSKEAAATLVIFNAKDPSSRALAEYYAKRRNIDAKRVLGLECSSAEEISREEFLVDIEAPLRRKFNDNGWWQIDRDANAQRIVTRSDIRFVAIMRGVPMKIRPKAVPVRAEGASPPPPATTEQMLFSHDEASVDSELAALFALGHGEGGAVANPYYRRFSRIFEVPPSGAPLLVCRLDGPSDAIVRRMIDDSLNAEKNGLWGWGYADARGITSGGYAAGDAWILDAATTMRKQGIPVITDKAPETWRVGFPVTDAAVYYGWYDANVSGPFADPNFRFVPGAVAAHLHSFSAATIRNPDSQWVGPLLARGAAATVGNVYEPFLEMTVHFDILQDRLMSGLTLAESAYAASRAISWMGVVLGDPLYRPYASLFSLEGDSGEKNMWQQYRSVVLAAGGDPIAASAALRKLATELDQSMPLEALGQAQAAAGDLDAARKTLAEAAAIAKKPAIRFRLALEEIEILRRSGDGPAVKARIAKALETFRGESEQATLGRVLLAFAPPPPPPTPAGKPKKP